MILECDVLVIPNITYANENYFDVMLDGMEETEVVAFSAKGSMREFDEKEFHEAVRWFISTIESIYQEIFFRDKIAIEYSEKKKDIDTYKEDDFFCNYLCSVGNDCCRCGRKV